MYGTEPRRHEGLARHRNNRKNRHHRGGTNDSGGQSAPGTMKMEGPTRRSATGPGDVPLVIFSFLLILRPLTMFLQAGLQYDLDPEAHHKHNTNDARQTKPIPSNDPHDATRARGGDGTSKKT
jgi:hypothetical protein